MFKNCLLGISCFLFFTNFSYLQFEDISYDFKITNLKVNFTETPLGLDDKHPLFSWQLKSNSRGVFQTAYEIRVSTTIQDKEVSVWNSGKINSNKQHNIAYNGDSLKPKTRYNFKIRAWNQKGEQSDWSKISWFETGMLYQNKWIAKWIDNGMPIPSNKSDFYKDIPNPIFRKEFILKKLLHEARLYISGLGYYEAYLNGIRIGDHELDPGWTNYNKEVLYSVYDITENLKTGINAIGISLGNGWYNPLPLELFKKYNLRDYLAIGRPKVLAELLLIYTDGTTEIIKTDTTWKSGNGHILKNDVYLGETIDAGLYQEGWNMADFDDTNWENAKLASQPLGKLVAQKAPPIKITKRIKPKTITEVGPNIYVIDFGQNLAGWFNMKLKGASDTKIHFKYGEILDSLGLVNGNSSAAGHIKEAWNLSGGDGAPLNAYQEDIYILKGNANEYFQQHFTFHGFRYVEIRGYTKKPVLDDIFALRLNSDIEQAGHFECSDSLFNAIQKATDWTFKSNLFSIQSDCPTREKFGYGADIVVTANAFISNYHMATFYQKTINDFKNDQRSNGGMPETAPFNGIDTNGYGDGSGPIGWQLAFPFLIDQLYQAYGDLNAMKTNYEAVITLADHLIKAAGTDFMLDVGIGDHGTLASKNKLLTSTAFYYHVIKLSEKFAKILDKTEDAKRFENLSSTIKNKFIAHFFSNNGQLIESAKNQGNLAFILYYGLHPEGERARLLKTLETIIDNDNNTHFSTGIFGTWFLFNVLEKYNLDHLLFKMVSQEDFPSYGYMLKKGATTLWEGWRHGEHASQNHPMYGSVSEWFYKSVLGISQKESGIAYSEIMIKPKLTSFLDWAKGNYESNYGVISVNWQKTPYNLEIDISIPVNTTAVVAFPKQSKPSKIEEKEGFQWGTNIALNKNEHIQYLNSDNDFIYFKVASGHYNFLQQY